MSLPSRPQLALVLNAHTPYIRHPRGKWCNDEYWFYDHLLDSYLPLLDLLERLESEGLPYRLALSLSPTLLEMWADPTLQERFAQYLERKIQLAERERERCIFELELSELIDYYASRLQYYQDKYENLYKRQIIPAWSDLAKKGRLELLTTGATSALLPLLYPYTSLIRAQIKVGLETFARHLGFRPRGFWLPECAFKPGLEELLAEEGLEYTHTTPCQNVGSVPPSACGGIAPIRNANSFVFFPNDAETEIELWSARSGYYTDFAYRNATRDLSDEWPQLDLGDFQLPDQERPATGFRYFHNGPAPENEYYNLEEGRELARLHAKVFWSNRQRQLARTVLIDGASHRLTPAAAWEGLDFLLTLRLEPHTLESNCAPLALWEWAAQTPVVTDLKWRDSYAPLEGAVDWQGPLSSAQLANLPPRWRYLRLEDVSKLFLTPNERHALASQGQIFWARPLRPLAILVGASHLSPAQLLEWAGQFPHLPLFLQPLASTAHG